MHVFGDRAARFVMPNVQPYDAGKYGAQPLIADALVGLKALDGALGRYGRVLPRSQQQC